MIPNCFCSFRCNLYILGFKNLASIQTYVNICVYESNLQGSRQCPKISDKEAYDFSVFDYFWRDAKRKITCFSAIYSPHFIKTKYLHDFAKNLSWIFSIFEKKSFVIRNICSFPSFIYLIFLLCGNNGVKLCEGRYSLQYWL